MKHLFFISFFIFAPTCLGADKSQPCTATQNCSSTDRSSCTVVTNADAEAYACYAWHKHWSCGETAKKGPRLSIENRQVLNHYFNMKSPEDHTCSDSALQEGSIRAAIWMGRKRGYIHHGVQVLPSFSLGIPLTNLGGENDASRALHNVGSIGGIVLRYSPNGFWSSIHGFAGTTSFRSDVLQTSETVYKNPTMLISGIGIDTLSGSLSFSLARGTLRHDGLFSETKSSSTFLQLGIDLTAIGLTLAGAMSR